MSNYNRGYNNDSRSNRNKNYRGGRGSHNHSHKSKQSYSEICRYFIQGECTTSNCRIPHVFKKIGEAKGHKNTIKDIVMWEAQEQLLTCAADSTIKLWKCSDWSELTTISVLPDGTKANPNSSGISVMLLEGSWLFAGFESPLVTHPTCDIGLIRAWNLDSPTTLAYDFLISETMMCSHTRGVSALAFATLNGIPTVFSGSINGDIRYWQLDVNANAFKCLGLLEGHARSITRLKTVDSTMLISASLEGSIKIVDLSTLAVVHMLAGHDGAVTDLEVWVNANETFLISSGLDKKVLVHQLSAPFNQVFEEKQTSPVMCLCGTQDTKQVPILLLGLQNGDILVKELPTFKYKTQLSMGTNTGHRDTVRRIVKGPSHTFFSAGEDRKVFAWQITDGVDTIPSSK